MDKPPETFFFTAQQSPFATVSPDLPKRMETNGSAKRARAEVTSCGRSDVVIDNLRKYGRFGAGNQGTMGSMGGVGKAGVTGNGKKPITEASGSGKTEATGSSSSSRSSGINSSLGGTSNEMTFDKFTQTKIGVKAGTSSLWNNFIGNRGSGSRFDVLGDEDYEMLTDVGQNVASKASGNVYEKNKGILTEITNCAVGSREASINNTCPMENPPTIISTDDEDLDSARVLRLLHKEVKEFAPHPVDLMEIVEGVSHSKVIYPITSLDRNFDMVASDLKEVLAVISE
ncbi:hypothetical protein Q3G72_031872 [Acer saccharum]|nr:hypothetical protein Q3G72_031872 [Acer saccharum]